MKRDEMAKLEAIRELDLCQHACATKAWWYTEAWKRYLVKWRIELGIKHSLDEYSEEYRNMTFTQARALDLVFCNRTPSDCLPQKEPEQYPYGQESLSARHLFKLRNLLDTARTKIFDKTAKDMHEDDFFFNPNNTE
jgi:hypothetical protein